MFITVRKKFIIYFLIITLMFTGFNFVVWIFGKDFIYQSHAKKIEEVTDLHNLEYGQKMVFAKDKWVSRKFFILKSPVMPKIHRMGDPFNISGLLKSRNKIKYIRVGVVDENGRWIKGCYVDKYFKKNKTGRAYSLKKNISPYLDLSKLVGGNYHLRIYARDWENNYGLFYSWSFKIRVPEDFEIEDAKIPTKLYKGDNFEIGGKLRAISKMRRVDVGIFNKKNKKLSGACFSANPKSDKYDVNKLGKKIDFSKIPSGLYQCKLKAEDVNGESKTIIDSKFSISEINGTNFSKPSIHRQGRGFGIKGTIVSTFRLMKVTAGVMDESGTYVSGIYASDVPKKTSYNLSKLDSKIKFGRLKAGKYKYVVEAQDNKGYNQKLLEQTFEVKIDDVANQPKAMSVAPISLIGDSDGLKLKYSSELIDNIGKQPMSGPCGQYAMGYCRAILDGSLEKGNFETYYEKFRQEYGFDSHLAYWSQAGAYSLWTDTAKIAYQLAYDELNAGRPAILPINNFDTGNNHFITVIGYVNGTTRENVTLKSFIIIDPATGKESFMKDKNYGDKLMGQTRIIKFYR